MKIYAAAFFLSLMLANAAKAQDAADLCSYSKLDKRLVGKSVSVKAKIISDGMHATLLQPKDCEEKSYSLAPDAQIGSPGSIIWQAVMRVGAPGTVDVPGVGSKIIDVDVLGEVVRLDNGTMAIRVTKLRRMTFQYSSN